MSAGYSSTPLAKKIGVKEGTSTCPGARAPEWTIDELPADVVVSRVEESASRADVVVAFFTQLATMQPEVDGLSRLITVNGALWLAWPRRAGGHDSDITETYVRDVGVADSDSSTSRSPRSTRTGRRSSWYGERNCERT